MNDDVEIIKSRINIVEVVSEKVRLKKAGVNYFGLCPFHNEHTPSFSVNENLQLFKCFGCGKSGDVITFLMESEGREFREVLEDLAEKVGHKLHTNKQDPQKTNEEDRLFKLNDYVRSWYQKKLFQDSGVGKAYAEKRGLTQELITKFGIGYSGEARSELSDFFLKKGLQSSFLESAGISVVKEGKVIDKFRNRLMFTIYNERGKVVGFSGRNLLPEDPNFKPPKYLNSPETLVFKKSKLLFGLFQARSAISKLNFVIVSEGQMNIISSHKVGVENIVASLGTSFTKEHLKLLSRMTSNIYLAFDKDEAGKKALFRTLEIIFQEDLDAKVIHWDSSLGKDPDEVIQKNSKYWLEAVTNPVDPVEYMYSQFVKKFGNDDVVKLNNFIKTMLKLIYSNHNEVKRQFYLKYLSEKTGIPVTGLTEQVSKSNHNIVNVQKKAEPILETKHHEQSIYDTFFILMIQNWQDVNSLLFAMEREWLPQEYQELFDCLLLFTDENEFQVICASLEDDVREKVENYMLSKVILDDTVAIDTHISKLIVHTRNEYKKKLILEWRKNPLNEELQLKVNKILQEN